MKSGICAFLVMLAISTGALAVPPQVHTQVPGYYRTQVGEFEVTALLDGYLQIGQTVIKGVSEDTMRGHLDAVYLPLDRPAQTAVNAFIVNTGKNLVLVDTGAAACFGAGLGNIRGNLAAAGYKPEDIDTVLLTHLHGDHVCGLTDAAGKAVFANATVWAAREEGDYWLNETTARRASKAQQASFKIARDAIAPYAAHGRYKTWKEDDTLLPGLTVVPTHGHTPGHSSYLFQSKGETLLVWGDIVNSHALQFDLPDVSTEFDSNAKAAVATRRKVFADVAAKRVLVAGAHLPFPGIGHVRAAGRGYQWVPAQFGQVFPGK